MAEDVASLTRRISELEAKLNALCDVVDVGSGGTTVTIKAPGNLTIRAGGSIDMRPGNNFQLASGGGAQFNIGGNFSLSSNRAEIQASGALTVAATSGDIDIGGVTNLATGTFLSVSAGSGLSMAAGGMLDLKGGNGIALTSGNKIKIDATHDLNLLCRNHSVSASIDMKLASAKTLAISSGKAATIEIGDDLAVKVSKSAALQTGDEIGLKTGAAALQMRKDGTFAVHAKDFTVQASGQVNVKASSDVVLKGSKIRQN